MPPPAPISGVAAAIFLTPHTWDLPPGGGALEITIETAAHPAGGVPAPHVRVTLTASSGSLSVSEPQTDATGHAKATWTGSSSATITARAGDVEGTSTIRVAAPTPGPPPNPNPNPSPGPTPNPTPPGPPAPPKPPPPGRGPAGDLVATISASPANPDANQSVRFTVILTSSNGSAVPTIEQYVWDVSGDRLPDRFEASPTATYPAAGTYVVEVEIHTADNRAVNAFYSLPVGPVPSVRATLSASPTNAGLGETVTLTATAMPTGNTGSLSYAWDFDGNGTTDQTTAGNSTTTSYGTIGTKKPEVTVTGSRGAPATAATTVNVTAPALSITGLNVSGTRSPGSTLTFTATVSAASGSVPSPLTFKWDFGNGSEIVTSPSPQSINHVYGSAGTYKVTVTVTAADGRTATNDISVKVE